jgi:hypothetical protein
MEGDTQLTGKERERAALLDEAGGIIRAASARGSAHDGRGFACARSDESGADTRREDRPFKEAPRRIYETVNTTGPES